MSPRTTSPLELIEVRQAVEPQMARLAVLHASARDLETLADALAAWRAAAMTASCSRAPTSVSTSRSPMPPAMP